MIKSLMRKFSILLTSLFLLAVPVFAQSQSTETKLVEVLERPECQHCQADRIQSSGQRYGRLVCQRRGRSKNISTR